MRNPRILLLLSLTACVALGSISLLWAQGSSQASSGKLVLNNCVIRIKDMVEVPAREAGALEELKVTVGSTVEKGEVLGNIDDSQPQLQLKLATAELAQATMQADEGSKFDIDYSVKAAEVAKVDYERSLQLNAGARTQIVSDMELEYKKLSWEKLVLQTGKAKFDQIMAIDAIKIKQVEVDAANMMIQRRQIVAPINGEVRVLARHQGEWVAPGDTVLRIENYETLYVYGNVPSDDFNRGMLLGKSVTVEVERDNGRRVMAAGKIVSADVNVVQAEGDKTDFYVVAEVKNSADGVNWELLPGLLATMTIDVN